MADGVIADSMQAGFLLKESPDFPGLARHKCLLALPAQRSVFRQIDVPLLKGPHLDEFVAREIRRELPMLAENAYVSWTVCGQRDDRLDIFIVGAARDVLESHVEAARAAGLHPMSVDLRIIAAARAIGTTTCVIANVEEDDAEIAIFHEGVPAIVRYVTMVPAANDAGWADQLAEEIARTAKFYRDSHRNDHALDSVPISFVGGAARRAVLAEQITPATGLDVAMPQLRITLRQEEQTVRFAANIGLALKDLAA
jgi:Tfp pilus assembly PilM family ATPase